MTVEQKNEVILKHCKCGMCGKCPIEYLCDRVGGKFIDHEEECSEAYDILTGLKEENDIINHPSHYNREGAMESIDEMELIFGKEAVKHFCLCNAWKYRYRSSAKNGEEDIKKSDWYIRKYKELTANECQ